MKIDVRDDHGYDVSLMTTDIDCHKLYTKMKICVTGQRTKRRREDQNIHKSIHVYTYTFSILAKDMT